MLAAVHRRVLLSLAGIPDKLKGKSRSRPDFDMSGTWRGSWKNMMFISMMRPKIEAVFEHYAAQSEYYKRANIVQRFAMEDVLYRLTMELLGKIIGPFEVSDSVHCRSVSPVALAGL